MYFLQDFNYYNKKAIRIFYEIFFSNSGSAIFLFRLSSWFYNKKLQPIAVILMNLNTFLNSCQISYKAKIDEGFMIYHPVGIVIGDITAGKELRIFQNVTVGSNTRISEEGNRYPVLGNNVILYSGCVVAGPINIGNHVKVGANTVIQKNVSENSIVIGHTPIIK